MVRSQAMCEQDLALAVTDRAVVGVVLSHMGYDSSSFAGDQPF